MRKFLLMVILTAIGSVALSAQHSVPLDSIAPKLGGCWYATDGGTKGEYCFAVGGVLTITPHGHGREKLERHWSVDAKGNVVVKSGKHEIIYLIERLATDGFVLVNNKEDVRLEGHRDKPRHW